jgi:uncharacterized membrane protein (UPF0136 family)
MARQTPDTFATAAHPRTRHAATDRRRPLDNSLLARATVGAAVIGGLALGALLMLAVAGPPPARLQQDAELAGLVRAMVAIKGLLLIGALALVAWRLRRPVSIARLAGYAATLALSAAAVGWMWGLSAIPVAALAFYGGLIACYRVAARDPGLLAGTRHR